MSSQRSSNRHSRCLARVSQIRRQAAAQSLSAFCDIYLAAHFQSEPSLMHHDLFNLLQSAQKQRGQRLAIAAPRNHAKSTIVSQAHVLWCICYGLEPFILLISNTVDQASDCLSIIKTELQQNRLLIEDFPEVCETPGVVPGAIRWRKEEIITRNDIKVTALGADKKIRGRKHMQHRPTLVILDDVENETEVRSADQRHYKQDWFNKAILKAGSLNTNVIVVGTILHFDSLLATLTDQAKSPGWTSRKFKAVLGWSERVDLWERWQNIYHRIDDFEGASGQEAARRFYEQHRDEMLRGTRVLWPQREDYYRLMELRLVEGRASFDSEKQNEPVNPEDCYFQDSDFRYWEDEFESLEHLVASVGPYPKFFGACDPSLGRLGRSGSAARGDDSAIISILWNPRNKGYYVVDADIKHRKPAEIIDSIIQYQRLRGYRKFGMETNQFQSFLADELRRRSALAGSAVNVFPIHQTTDKLGRIQKLEPLIKGGLMRFSRRHTLLLDQLRQFPMAAHDDGPDALEMAVRTSDTFRYQWSGPKVINV